MSQLCRVCGEPAAGFHFGAFTCEGCKSFFGRTYNNLGSITECKNNNECVINKKNRTSCKACRLRKCLAVGMSKSGSRYGRRSNWFKIHCLLQEQHQHHQQQQHHHQHQNHRLQHQLQQQPRSQQQPVASGDGGAPLQRIQLAAAVPGGPRPDADNNNYCAVAGGDPDKNVARSAVPPELLLRWASPFFPVFPPFPPPGPFFPRELRAARRTSVEREPPTRSTGRSSASRSSADRDDDDDDDRDDGRASPGGVRLPPVQESPMDLSASAAPLRSPSPPDVRGRRTTDPCPADRSGSRRRMRRRRRRRRRRSSPSDDRSTPSDGSESFSDGSESSGGGERPAKSSPLDLTCIPPRS